MTMVLAAAGTVTAEPVHAKPDGGEARSAAAGGGPVDRESTERVRLTDQPAVSREAPDAGGWVELADPTPARHGKEFIPVGANAGAFTRLRVEVHSGRVFVQRVRVDFQDGGHKIARIATRLAKRGKRSKPSVVVDFGGAREIKQVVVTTDRAPRGTYTVHASVEQPAVATRARPGK
jgi:hypothetical protein